MVRYRRDRTPGATYFFTVTLVDRRADYLTRYVDELGQAFRAERKRRPFDIDAIVVLPEHLHTIWTLPDGDDDYPLRWRQIKARFARLMRAKGFESSGTQQRGAGPWQSRYWEHRVRDENDFGRHVDYIHYNPVKHGLVRRVRDWRWSSFHRYVRAGTLPLEWGDGHVEVSGAYGE